MIGSGLIFVNIDDGFDVLTLLTIFNFPQLAFLENEEEEIGGHTVERVTSLSRQLTQWLFIMADMRQAFSNSPISIQLFRL